LKISFFEKRLNFTTDLEEKMLETGKQFSAGLARSVSASPEELFGEDI